MKKKETKTASNVQVVQQSEQATTSIKTQPATSQQNKHQKSQQQHSASGRTRKTQWIQARVRRLSLGLFCLVGSISCLAPFLSLYTTNRIGLLLLETELLQMRSSLYATLLSFLILVSLGLVIYYFVISRLGISLHRRNFLLQRILQISSAMFGVISLLGYLSIALVVPHIKQTQRMPLANFDCQANEISIENCQQQFATSNLYASSNSDYSLINRMFNPIERILFGDLNANSYDDGGDRLIRKLDCLKYNHQDLRALKVPTRFLLHKCGLVCQPQRQHLHQFNDDLNSFSHEGYQQVIPSLNQNTSRRRLVAPYISQVPGGDRPQSEQGGIIDGFNNPSNVVTLKICFSDEVDGIGSNYKKFCIENLTNQGQSAATRATRDTKTFAESNSPEDSSSALTNPEVRTGTSGYRQQRLSTILTRFSQNSDDDDDTHDVHGEQIKNEDKHEHRIRDTNRASIENESKRNIVQANPIAAATSNHYVNPIVQFESHFKNWPHLKSRPEYEADLATDTNHRVSNDLYSSTSRRPSELSNNGWCKFKPIPPFIVNNKPFSDIQCSLEHEYSITTSSQLQYLNSGQTNADGLILLKKSPNNDSEHTTSSSSRERCSIQCKVNILYQVHLDSSSSRLNAQQDKHISDFLAKPERNYYLPLKSCLFLQGLGDKERTSNQYLLYRSIADTSLLLTIILIDLLLLIESVDTNQFYLEGKKVRLSGILASLLILPMFVALLFDMVATWLPKYTQHGRDNGYLISFLNNQLVPTISDTLSSLYHYISSSTSSRSQYRDYLNETISNTVNNNLRSFSSGQDIVVDNYLVPFLIYAILMFIFTLIVAKMPIITSDSISLLRAASTEELGLVEGLKNSDEGDLDCTEKTLKVKTNPTIKHSTNSLDRIMKLRNAKKNTTKQNHRQSRKPSERVVYLALLTLFLGLQFNLSQMTQTNVMIETFELKNDLKQQDSSPKHSNSYSTLWFIMATQSTGSLVILLIVIIFSDEASAFLSEFLPFKSQKEDDKDGQNADRKRKDAKFKFYLGISLTSYAARYFILANLSQTDRMRWSLVFLFQVIELLNFPLTWFVITAHAHDMLNGQLAHLTNNPESTGQKKDSQAQTMKLLYVHMLIQAILAFVYFILARFLALFLHTLHASLHLHSDNIDWFIETLHKENTMDGVLSKTTRTHSPKNTTSSSTTSTTRQEYNNDSNEATLLDQQTPLFSPLPSERQTYLHASRLFIKYNSLVCLLLGIVLLTAFFHLKYELWLADKRQQSLEQQRARMAQKEQDSLEVEETNRAKQSIIERLRWDLANSVPRKSRKTTTNMRRNQSDQQITTLAHVPIRHQQSLQQLVGYSTTTTDEETPRARIHFRYDVGPRRARRRPHLQGGMSADSTSSSTSISTSTSRSYELARQNHIEPTLIAAPPPPGFDEGHNNIPIFEENDDDEGKDQNVGQDLEQTTTSTSTTKMTKMTKTTTRKRICLVGDDEDWSLDQMDEIGANIRMGILSPPPAEFADSDENCGATDMGQMRPAARLVHNANDKQQRQPNHQQQPTTNVGKRISFAPTATLIDHDGQHKIRATTMPSSVMAPVLNTSSTTNINANYDDDDRMTVTAAATPAVVTTTPTPLANTLASRPDSSATDTSSSIYNNNRAKAPRHSASNSSSTSTSGSARCASPEPSIDGDYDEDYVDNNCGSGATAAAGSIQVTKRKWPLGETDSIDSYNGLRRHQQQQQQHTHQEYKQMTTTKVAHQHTASGDGRRQFSHDK